MLIVTGHISVAPSALATFSRDLRALAAAARRRDGNLAYDAAVADPSTGRLLIAERWRDQAALTAHLQAADTARFLHRWRDRISGDIRKYDVTRERALMDD
ncbi:putative quinol monooxygenase [Sphingomonas sp. NFR15]|uniref:putative quinol monooxygenase n=1 Tax=Sphingomonas sp. NFR15 TaxID=1566282 RepID=UPI00088003BF|nr:antibiotic biosynthesis monooxygenase [Sphingomonas sp. NFR15]SDA14535.1 Quinol monooxygenase YgiN [Sphingomonas sp. NFR15]